MACVSMKTVVNTRLATPAKASRCVVVRAASENVDRRAVFGLFAAVAAAAVVAPQEAKAIKLPSQEFTGGLVSGGGMIKSTTQASMESYNMEGTKKYGISPKKKAALMAKAKASASKAAKS